MDPVEVIKKVICEKGLKKKYVAEEINFTAQQFSDLLSYRRNLNKEDVVPICKVLGITPNELYGYKKTNEEVTLNN